MTKAAERRAARIAARKSPDAPEERGAGVSPEMWIVESSDRLTVSIRFATQDGEPASLALLPDFDRVLRDLRVTAWATLDTDTPTLTGYEVIRVATAEAIDIATIDRVRPVMRRLDRFMEMVREESEDLSFAKAIDSLAAHLRVLRIVHLKDGLEQESKRGAAYITALRIETAFLEAQLDSLTRDDIREAA
jgi:hypothetical protein